MTPPPPSLSLRTGSPTRAASKFPVFYLNVVCPRHTYDICLDPTKTLVQFQVHARPRKHVIFSTLPPPPTPRYVLATADYKCALLCTHPRCRPRYQSPCPIHTQDWHVVEECLTAALDVFRRRLALVPDQRDVLANGKGIAPAASAAAAQAKERLFPPPPFSFPRQLMSSRAVSRPGMATKRAAVTVLDYPAPAVVGAGATGPGDAALATTPSGRPSPKPSLDSFAKRPRARRFQASDTLPACAIPASSNYTAGCASSVAEVTTPMARERLPMGWTHASEDVTVRARRVALDCQSTLAHASCVRPPDLAFPPSPSAFTRNTTLPHPWLD